MVLERCVNYSHDLVGCNFWVFRKHVVQIVYDIVETVGLINVNVRIKERNAEHQSQHYNNHLLQSDFSQNLPYFALIVVDLLDNLCVKELICRPGRWLSLEILFFYSVLR